MRVNLLRAGGVVSLTAAVVLLVALTPATAATTDSGHGSAYGADASVSLLPGVLGAKGLAVTTRELAASNTAGPTSASTVDATLKGLVSAKVITSTARHDDAEATVTSTADLVHVALPLLAALAGTTPTVEVVKAQCRSTTHGITGSSDLVDVDLGRIGDLSAATPGTTIDVPGVAKIIADEQIHHADGSLTVNALHIILLGGTLTRAVGSGDIVLASATCAKVAAAPPTTTTTTTPAPAPGPAGQVRVVPAGAPETGDGSLAAVVVD
jgi:hypothetical protein